jgi:hypothetical protein
LLAPTKWSTHYVGKIRLFIGSSKKWYHSRKSPTSDGYSGAETWERSWDEENSRREVVMYIKNIFTRKRTHTQATLEISEEVEEVLRIDRFSYAAKELRKYMENRKSRCLNF